MDGLKILNDKQLRGLARVIYHKEAEAIHNIKFKSEPQRAKYLRHTRDTYKAVVGILDAGTELNSKYQDDEIKGPIARDIKDYFLGCTNFALQAVRNHSLRLNYVEKIKIHADELIDQVNSLNVASESEVEALAKKAIEYRNSVMEYTRSKQSPAFRAFSKNLKARGLTFEKLVEEYGARLNYTEPFERLDAGEKIEIYNAIIEASGRGNPNVTEVLSKYASKAGKGLLLLTVGILVYEVTTSDHVFETLVSKGSEVAAAIGASMIGEAAAVGLATMLGLAPVVVFAAGVVTGFVVGFIIGALVGSLVESIIHSGSTTHEDVRSHAEHIFSTEGHRGYVAPMPDNPALANQIAHIIN